MELVRRQLEALEVQEQQQLMLEFVTASSPEVQLNLLLPSVTAAASYVKWRLVTNLQGQDTPDLLLLLPPELQVAVLSFLDGPSLLRASQVSTIWNSIIKNHGELWMEQCRQLGVNISKVPKWIGWHRVYVTSLRQQASLRNGTAFTERFMQLQNCKKAVKAVDYQDGFLCTVSEEDYINIWQLDLNIPVLTFPVKRAVSCIKFRPNSLLLCGHFVGTLTSWDLCGMSQSRCTVLEQSDDRNQDFLKNKYKMHAGPVFSCDFSEELDLLISGGADECLKLWSLSSALQVKSMSNQRHWVLKVILIPDLSFTSNHEIVYMTRKNVKKISWPSSIKCDSKSDVRVSVDDSADSLKRYGAIEKISATCNISINEGPCYLFTPGLQFSSKYIGLIKQDVEEKHAHLCVFDIQTFKLEHNILLNIKVKKLIALGNRYALLLTMGTALYSSTLVIIDIITTKIIGTHSIPHSKMTTPDGAQLVVGNVEWLDGLGVHLPEPAHSLPAGHVEASGCDGNVATSAEITQKLTSHDNRREVSESCMNTRFQCRGENTNALQNLMACLERKQKAKNSCNQHFDNCETELDLTDVPCSVHSDKLTTSTITTQCECASDQCNCCVMESLSEVCISQQQKQPSFLVLAAGILNEPGRLFTLWWAQARDTHKCKKE